jgi:phospholipid/cholesterol/gamma-HCH transport system substrate-binding protein
MATPTNSSTKLGLLVLSGLFLFILTLYIIGKNQNMFGSSYKLKARFTEVNGLMKGNNIRFSGIQAGTVKSIRIIDDTTIEVVMMINNDLKPYIHTNADASIGTEGLIGNKVINITPGKGIASIAEDGDMLNTRRLANTEDMLQTLSKTNDNIATISEGLKQTVQRINTSAALWRLLNDSSLPANTRSALAHIRQASANADRLTGDLQGLISDVRHGKGAAGTLLADTVFANKLTATLDNLRLAGMQAGAAVESLDSTVKDVHENLTNGKGTVTALLRDTAMLNRVNASLENIQKGTESFSQDMEALKHNFLLRGYFRKLEKKQKKEKAY